MFQERIGLIIWLNDTKQARGLEKFGAVHYISKKMKYAVLYTNAAQLEQTQNTIAKLPYVKRVELSLRNEIKTEYSSNIPDKTRFYSY